MQTLCYVRVLAAAVVVAAVALSYTPVHLARLDLRRRRPVVVAVQAARLLIGSTVTHPLAQRAVSFRRACVTGAVAR